jgi:hypothetical protein
MAGTVIHRRLTMPYDLPEGCEDLSQEREHIVIEGRPMPVEDEEEDEEEYEDDEDEEEESEDNEEDE